jgi:hypothetical protein
MVAGSFELALPTGKSASGGGGAKCGHSRMWRNILTQSAASALVAE